MLISNNVFFTTIKINREEVPVVAQWLTNLTAMAQIPVEEQVQSPAGGSGLKDPVLPQLRCRS